MTPPLAPYVVLPLYALIYPLLQTSGSSNSIEYFGSLGVGGILAGVMFFFYRQDRKSTEDMLKRAMDEQATALKENTTVMTRLTDIIEQYHRH